MRKKLTAKMRITVRFCEVDSLGVVWHGHYMKYLEDGRVAFGKKYGLDYRDIYERGYVAPITSIHCQYKKSLKYQDTIIIETSYINSEAMKLQFHYRIIYAKTMEVVATAESTQVLLDAVGSLVVVMPAFFKKWKKKWNLA